ncbi:TolC family protein [Arcobacter sp. CECT 8989]|uniref:TolC family protein n=1 Tax=Arcobacter sp. CECT 8989 TaxID=2044509 RepID=UPI0013E96889|nr:TolC family protein [Arcobacter sp. CECT 8989]
MTSSIYAKEVKQVVNEAINTNSSLQALEQSILLAKEQIDLAGKWQNPILNFGANDIQFDDISKRDLEPMQAQFIGLNQMIPIGDKKELEEEIARDDYELSKLVLADKKLELESKIYEYIYNIKLVEERVALFSKLKQNIAELQKLLEEFYKYNKASQIDILKVQTLYDELDISEQKLNNNLRVFKLQLEQLTYTKFKDIDISTELEKLTLVNNIDSHPKILQIEKNIEKFNTTSKFEEEKKNSDINFGVKYFQRDSKYEDYINISVAIPLSIYGSEDIKARKAKFKANEYKNLLQDSKLKFTNQIKILQDNIDNAFYSYKKLNESIIPKYNQIQKTLESYNRFSSLKQIDSKQLIRNLNELIKYKLKAIDEKQKYFTSLSNSIYFTKVNK